MFAAAKWLKNLIIMGANIATFQQKNNQISVEIQPGASLNFRGKKVKTTRDVLACLLDEMQPINFSEYLETDEGDKTPQKHYIVVIIDEILRIAERNAWDLCYKNGYLYAYNGEYWQAADKDEFRTFLGEAAQRLGYKDLECRHYKFRNELFNQFLAVANFPAPEPDKNKTLINLKNGTLEITANNFQLRDFDKNDFLTYQLNFEYDAKADCPIFLDYLNKVLPDNDARRILGEFIGYVFTRHLKLEKCLMLYGSGANGKSVFFDVMNALLGKENVSNFSLANLGEEHNRALIVNKLLNYGSEIRGKIEADIFKQMASGEPIQARLKYAQSFITDQYAKLAFNANELPREVEHTNAYFRRFLIVPFEVTIPENEQDKRLAEKVISNELPGVLNWVLIGLSRLLKQGKFSPCEAVRIAVENYRIESDSVALFLSENGYKPSLEGHKTLQELYSNYKDFCYENGNKPLNNRNFAKRLRDGGYSLEKRNIGQIVFIEK